MNCEQHFQQILHRIDTNVSANPTMSQDDILEQLFNNFDTFAAMDLSQLPRQVFEPIFERITAPQLRRLERYNSVKKNNLFQLPLPPPLRAQPAHPCS